jgi:hypothetical protein
VDAIAVEALANLTTAMTSLLPPPADPALAPSILVTPLRITPTGVGGFTGMHPDPEGEVLGRRVSARVTVSVAAQNTAGLNGAVTQVTHAVMSAGRDELSQMGILRLGVLELGAQPVPAQGPPSPVRRDIAFDVLYEFLKVPEEAGGVITTIPLDIDSTQASNDPRVLFEGAFLPNALNLFDVVDDAAASTAAPSSWTYDVSAGAIRQSSLIRGGAEGATPSKPGTLLLLRTSPARPAVRDFSLGAGMLSESAGGIGFVFRFIDAGNFYFALLDSRSNFRLLAKKVAGAFAVLDAGGLDDARGFTVGMPMQVRLTAQENSFQLRIDGVTVLEGEDDDIDAAGRVGFMTRNCNGARFFNMKLVRL